MPGEQCGWRNRKTRFETFRVATKGDKGFVVTNARTGRFGLYEFDWKSFGDREDPFSSTLKWISTTFWMNDAGDGVEAVFYTDDRERVVWFDPELKELQEEIDEGAARAQSTG